jgi:hypothetical protein
MHSQSTAADEINNDRSSREEAMLALEAGASDSAPKQSQTEGENKGEEQEDEEEAWTVVPHEKWLVRRRWRKAFLFVARAR